MNNLNLFMPSIICFSIVIIQIMLAVFRNQRAKKARIDKIVAEAESRRLREREREQRRIAAEDERRQRERRQKERQQQIAAEIKKLRDAEMSEHRLMVAEQRRLMTDSLRYDILVRDGFRCCICGASAADGVKLHVDHILPVSKGGKTERSNLRTLCERCNLGKRDKIESVPVPSAAVRPTNPAQPEPQVSPVDSVPSALPAEPPADIQDLTMDQAKRILDAFGIRFVDHTDRGGCFWIELTPQSQALLQDKTISGKIIHTARRSKAFSNAPALFIK